MQKRVTSLLIFVAAMAVSAVSVTAAVDGWPARGVVNADTTEYLTFRGSAWVRGTAVRMYTEGPNNGHEGTLHFEPAHSERKKHPVLAKSIDVWASEKSVRQVGLPWSVPVDQKVCGYKVPITLHIGTYFRYNVSNAGGEDTIELLGARGRGVSREIMCTEGDMRIDPTKPLDMY